MTKPPSSTFSLARGARPRQDATRQRDRASAMDDLDLGAMLLWALPYPADRKEIERRRNVVARADSKRLDAFAAAAAAPAGGLAGAAPSPLSSVAAVLATLYALKRREYRCPSPVAHELTDRVLDDMHVELAACPVEHQWRKAELPLAVAAVVDEARLQKRLVRAGRTALTAGLKELLDGRGLLHAGHLTHLRPLLACWTRCRALGETLADAWSTSAEGHYQRLVRGALHLARPDGSAVFANGKATSDHELLVAALRFGGDAVDAELARTAFEKLVHERRDLPAEKRLPGGAKQAQGAQRAKASGTALPALPKPALHSEWAATAVLRTAWSRRSPRLTVVFPDQRTGIELCVDGRPLLSGDWAFEVRRGGQRLAPRGAWEEICWVSDKEVDYLELQIELADDVRLQRHVMLSRADETALLADTVLTSSASPGLLTLETAGAIEYRGALPLPRGARFVPAAETREGHLVASGGKALVMPLALGEWRTATSGGELTSGSGQLVLTARTPHRNLFAPLWFDLDPRRVKGRRTWRTLTVGESLLPVAADMAVGFRVAVENRQWLLYRALARRGNRTLLGHNISSEMLVARFDRRGEVHPLIELE